MAEASANSGGGGSPYNSGNSTPGSRFKVDNAASSGSQEMQLPPMPPLARDDEDNRGAAAPPPPYNGDGDGMLHKSDSGDNGTKTVSTELLSPGSREGELSVPIIELPDGEFCCFHTYSLEWSSFLSGFSPTPFWVLRCAYTLWPQTQFWRSNCPKHTKIDKKI
jgi:hypothetical protein